MCHGFFEWTIDNCQDIGHSTHFRPKCLHVNDDKTTSIENSKPLAANDSTNSMTPGLQRQ